MSTPQNPVSNAGEINSSHQHSSSPAQLSATLLPFAICYLLLHEGRSRYFSHRYCPEMCDTKASLEFRTHTNSQHWLCTLKGTTTHVPLYANTLSYPHTSCQCSLPVSEPTCDRVASATPEDPPLDEPIAGSGLGLRIIQSRSHDAKGGTVLKERVLGFLGPGHSW